MLSPAFRHSADNHRDSHGCFMLDDAVSLRAALKDRTLHPQTLKPKASSLTL